MAAPKGNKYAKGNKGGRPCEYTDEIGVDICTRLSEGESLINICKDDNMPATATVYRWLFTGEHKEFQDNYERAREIQAERMAEEIIEIADDGTNDYILKKFGEDEKEVMNAEHVQRSRLRVDARKWVASKLLPKKYGDKTQQEITTPPGRPIEQKWTIEFINADTEGK